MEKYTESKFSATYYLAAHIREAIFKNEKDDYLPDYFEVTYPDFQEQMLNPKRQTILHDFIEIIYNEGVEYIGRKLDHDSIIEDWTKLLTDYKVIIKSQDTCAAEEGYEDEDDIKSAYCNYLEKRIFEEVSSKVSDETFQILFSDRMFCLKFNSLIAEQVKQLKKKDFPDVMEKDGVVKRCAYFPRWVEKAVYYRDKGSCAVCLSDLSGLLKTSFDDAIDHIVPLNLGGINDITNFQLICRDCNLKKLGHTILTSEYYPRYFELE